MSEEGEITFHEAIPAAEEPAEQDVVQGVARSETVDKQTNLEPNNANEKESLPSDISPDDSGTKIEDDAISAEEAPTIGLQSTDDEKKEGENTIIIEEDISTTLIEENSTLNADAAENEKETTQNANEATNSGVPAERTSSSPTGKGAQILMNRFNSLTKRANQNAQNLWSKSAPGITNNAKAMQETAKSYWKQAPKIPVPVPVAGLASFAKSMNAAGTASVPPSTNAAQVPQERVEPRDSQSQKQDSNLEFDADNNTDVAVVAHSNITTQSSNDDSTGTEVQPKQFSLSDSSPNPNNASVFRPSSTDDDRDRESSVGGAADAAAARLRMGGALSKASAAASVAYESVLSTGFRGRYNDDEDDSDESDGDSYSDYASSVNLPESQTELILKSRVGQHMQEILNNLEPYEYAMLLGRGMLGVNLKQCYLKNHGVFIDFLVENGQAEASGIVRSGDLPVRLGDVDLRKGTIMEIPLEISRARRPVILILATGAQVSLERMNYIDVAVGMMHRAREYYNKRGTLSNLPSANSSGLDTIKSVSEVDVPTADSIDSFLTPPTPTIDIRKEFHDDVPLRSYEKFVVEGLCQVHDLDRNFREAMRNAFLTTALDTRRLTFLSRHFSEEENLPEGQTVGENKMTASAQLMLFLELTSFLDLYHVTPATRLREMANRVAYKFFLPSKVGNKLQPPLFDFHHIVPDASLRHLEFVLSGKSQSIPRDLFFDFTKAIVDSLTGSPFISFLTSVECARMRGYLRNTAPFVNLPMKRLFEAVTGNAKHVGANNCFAYVLLFLICQLEKEPAGENNFRRDEEPVRILGSSNDLCCAVFVRRTLVPTLTEMKEKINGMAPDADFDQSIAKKVVHACDQFWDLYISGTMDTGSKNNVVESSYNTVRVVLQQLAAELIDNEEKKVKMNRETVEAVTKSKLVEYANNLADELLFNFSSNINVKFREHKFHEWMCSELCKMRANDPNLSSNQEIPNLPQGCVKRLLRKAELPEGVSSHKPFKEAVKDDEDQQTYPNGEFAVVFGSSVGADLASRVPVPGVESSDIRRYVCLPIGLDREQDYDSPSHEDNLPPTFESYAIVPTQKRKQFSKTNPHSRLSKDGWEVSLVSFTIPNAESSGADSALYGVSLFLRCQAGEASVVQNRVSAFVPEDETSDSRPYIDTTAKAEFKSPIAISKVEDSESEGSTLLGDLRKTGLVKNVKVKSAISAFNDKHKTNSWVSRVLGDEYRDPSHPISIGLALVSRKNVILSMRDTLSRLLFDYSRDSDDGMRASALENCGALVDVLGNFSHRNIEGFSLQCILEPYLRVASAPWIERPISAQADAFDEMAMRQVTDCLPPTPLALMFITALLEQKIILSSSRRSILHSATVALRTLLQPLKWSHLLVPMVPASLASDLIQYPAPFILGIPSEEAENAELIGNLPRDVTLVDLDVGRVILAPDFGQDNDMVQKSDDPSATARALRSQVLYLAQGLGNVFGYSLKPESWLCDFAVSPGIETISDSASDRLKASASSFVAELLEGVSSCCYWIEEATQNYGSTMEPTVLFDEDNFFEIKNYRATKPHQPLFKQRAESGFALDLNNFDLVLESFLRCQSMSTYISSRSKTDMAYY